MLSDRPIDRAEDDLLARTAFARDVARRLIEGSGADPWVGAIHGKWGEGKTSVLNLIHVDLASHGDVVALKFDPWHLRAADEMLPRFFEELAGALRGPHHTRMRALTEELEAYGRHLSGLQPPFVALLPILQFLTHRLLYPPLATQRRRISELLRHHRKRVVVTIDDIDRLAPQDATEILRLVRLLADLPYIKVVLAFDPAIVGAAIATHLHIEDGAAFLRKIVQVPLILPTPHRAAVREYFLNSLHERVRRLPDPPSETDVGNYYRAWFHGLAYLPFTLRDAKRLLNLFDSYPANVLLELNPLDLLLLVTVRDRWPALYNWVSERKDDLTKFHDHRDNKFNEERLKAGFEPVYASVPKDEQEVAREFLNRLLPQFGLLWRGSSMGCDFQDGWYVSKKLCSPGYFDRYFHFEVPPAQVPERKRSELERAIIAGEPEEVSKQVAEWRRSHDVREVIDALGTIEKHLDATGVRQLLDAVVVNAHDLPAPPGEFSYVTPRFQWAAMIGRLLRKGFANDTAAFRSEVEAVLERVPLAAAYAVGHMLRGEFEESPLKEAIAAALAVLARRIQEAGVDLLDDPTSLSNALWYSRTFGNPDGHRALSGILIAQPDSAARLVLAYLGMGTEMESGDQHFSELNRNQYDDLCSAVDAESLRRVLLTKYLPAKDRPYGVEGKDLPGIAAAQFLRMDDLVRKGRTEDADLDGDVEP